MSVHRHMLKLFIVHTVTILRTPLYTLTTHLRCNPRPSACPASLHKYAESLENVYNPRGNKELICYSGNGLYITLCVSAQVKTKAEAATKTKFYNIL